MNTFKQALERIENMACGVRDPLNVKGGNVVAADGKFDEIRRIAREALAAPDGGVEGELLKSLKSLLFIHENVDETGYVTDGGFYPVEAEIEKVRALIGQVEGALPQPAPVGDERAELLARAASAEHGQNALSGLLCNINDTLRSRGFMRRPADEGVIELAQAYDKARAALDRSGGNPECLWTKAKHGCFASACLPKGMQWIEYSPSMPFCQKCGGRIRIAEPLPSPPATGDAKTETIWRGAVDRTQDEPGKSVTGKVDNTRPASGDSNDPRSAGNAQGTGATCQLQRTATAGENPALSNPSQTRQSPGGSVSNCDPRPQKGGWAPGPYHHQMCSDCGQSFTGDKRAITCAPCAYKDFASVKPAPAPQPEAPAERRGE